MVAAPSTGPEQFTRCPTCQTVFRVTTAQLAQRAGQVRCGHCKRVFDANRARVTSAPALPGDAESSAAAVAERPALSPDVGVVSASIGATEPAAAPQDKRMAGAQAPTPSAKPRKDRGTGPGGQRASRVRQAAYAVAIPLLVALLGTQALFHYSATIATHWPAVAPALTRLCETAGCSVRPVPDASMQYLAIDASDLHADPAHKGLLILTATIRNRAPWTLAYPHLELTLTNAEDQVVVRRALAPGEYAGGTVDVGKGIAGRGELAVKLFIDASATAQSGYRLYLFYP